MAALDGLAAALALAAVAIIVTGGFTVAGARLARAEDLVVAGVAVVALRALLRRIRLPGSVRGDRAAPFPLFPAPRFHYATPVTMVRAW